MSSEVEDRVLELVRAVVNHPRLVDEPWDSYALIAQISEDKEQLNGYRYLGDSRPAPTIAGGDEVFDLFAALRENAPGPAGELWEVAVLRIERDSGRFSIDYHYGDEAAAWRVDPSTFQRIAEAARPRPEDFG